MQTRENITRPNSHRGWPPSAHENPPPQTQGPATNQSIQQHPSHWAHPMRGSTAPSTTGASVDTAYLKASRYEPYHYHHTPRQQKYDFTIQDLDRCLFGKQNMRVVQINEKQTNTSKPSSGSEDKNKPAKWCDLCQEIRFGECPEHGPLTSLRDPTLSGPKSYAISTFPDEVGLCISTLPLAGYGVFARHFIPVGTWIGPYEGKKISVEEGMKISQQGDASFLWEIYENYRLAHFLDASDENNSSWMRFIQCARHRGEQNLFVFQYHGSIYYRAFKNILVREELLVWYDEKYPQYFGIPHELSDLSRANETGQPSMEASKAQAEFERHHGEGPNLSHHHYHHPPSGSQLIQGATGKTISSEKHSDPAVKGGVPHQKTNHPTSSKTFQGVPVQPPALSQAPTIPGDARSHHSSIYVTAGKTQPSSRPHSPRPGSVNSASFRRDHLTSSSSMLRSMSEDDLRHKRKDRPTSSHQRQSYEREHGERDRIPHTVEHMNPHAPPPGLLVHHGIVPPSHFSPATSYTRLPPVMSITPLDHSKVKHDELSKMHCRERPPVERMREHERMLHMQERVHPEFAEKVRRIQGAHHEMSAVPENWHEAFRCKSCGKSFNHKHAFDTHACEGQIRDGLHCNKCQISFNDPRDLHEHMLGHRDTSGEMPPFWCSICSRSFSSASSLKNHMKIHEKPNAEHLNKDGSAANRPAECAKCGKRFARPNDLTKHMNTPGECIS